MLHLRRLAFLVVAFGFSVNLARADFNSLTLPRAFQKSVPESVKDLQDIEQHVKKLLDKVIPATVGLQIGGSSGSGVIIDMEGHVLTAGHVSGPVDRDALVIFHDGTRKKGITLGGNGGIDSGLVQITDKGKWPFVEMAKIEELKKGHWCMAIGHPNGYVKGRAPVVRLGRVLEISKGYLRTDCTLVGGDSGGPLFDMHGRIIGIHSRIGGQITANMHVPVDTYRDTWDRLVLGEIWGGNLFGGGNKGAKGPKTTGSNAYLGLRPIADSKEFKVQTVAPDSPAAKAGVKVDDIIVSVDGKKLEAADELDKMILTKQPGNAIALEVRRGAEMLNLKAVLRIRRG